jgi:hypothetical protein
LSASFLLSYLMTESPKIEASVAQKNGKLINKFWPFSARREGLAGRLWITLRAVEKPGN